MTSDATSTIFQLAMDAGLVEYEPAEFRHEKRRRLLVTPEIRRIFAGEEKLAHFAANVEGRLVIGRFLAGHLVGVSRSKSGGKRKRRGIDVEQIVGADEVWALCFRTPPPGYRFFGRFLERDVLVLLRCEDKYELAQRYGEAASRVITDWELRLPGIPPRSGDDISDYLSEPFINVDEASDY